MKKYYFTFGSNERFPFQNTYLIIVAASRTDAIACFREKYPDRTPNCLNCSDYYNEKEWKKVKKYYKDRKPAGVLWTEKCYGKRPEGYEDLYIFVPKKKEIIRISEGTGDNLLPEDEKEGYVDYINYEQYILEDGIEEDDGGMILLEELFRKKYRCTADCIPDVLSMAYGNYLVNCMILA